MAIALDTNVLVALINRDDPLAPVTEQALEALPAQEQLVICGAAYGELMAFRGRTEKFLDKFLDDSYINVDWTFSETVWRTAGRSFSKYAEGRRKGKSGHPRRILTDFLIGAHAAVNHYKLLTLDARIYRTAFPKLELITY